MLIRLLGNGASPNDAHSIGSQPHHQPANAASDRQGQGESTNENQHAPNLLRSDMPKRN